jgi:hypothetical protein
MLTIIDSIKYKGALYCAFMQVSRIPRRAIQCGGFWGFRFFWVTSKEVPRVDSRKSPVEVKKSKPSKIYLALEIKASLWH